VDVSRTPPRTSPRNIEPFHRESVFRRHIKEMIAACLFKSGRAIVRRTVRRARSLDSRLFSVSLHLYSNVMKRSNKNVLLIEKYRESELLWNAKHSILLPQNKKNFLSFFFFSF